LAFALMLWQIVSKRRLQLTKSFVRALFDCCFAPVSCFGVHLARQAVQVLCEEKHRAKITEETKRSLLLPRRPKSNRKAGLQQARSQHSNTATRQQGLTGYHHLGAP
jgi:hypothetical protein